MKTIFTIIGVLIFSTVATWTLYGGFNEVNPVIIHSNGFFLVSEVSENHQEPNINQLNFGLETLEKLITCSNTLPAVYFKCTEYNKKDIVKGECFYGFLVNDDCQFSGMNEYENIRVMRVEEGNLLSVSSPYNGKLSVAFAIMRAYPALRMFCAKNNLPMDKPILEIYNKQEEKIEICMVLSNIGNS